MTWLAWLLLGIGTGDLLAAARPTLPRWIPIALACATVLTVAGLSDALTGAGIAVALLILATVVTWRVLLDRAEASAPAARRALAALILPALTLLAVSGWASAPAGPLAAWLGWIDLPGWASATPQWILTFLALGVVNTATGNHIVRLVLVSIHARPPGAHPHDAAPPASERLRGGRLLGPMERLIILGFGSTAALATATLIVAAKGLLRFPELQAAARSEDARVDEVTEYFLVGTFTSLLVALTSVAVLG